MNEKASLARRKQDNQPTDRNPAAASFQKALCLNCELHFFFWISTQKWKRHIISGLKKKVKITAIRHPLGFSRTSGKNMMIGKKPRRLEKGMHMVYYKTYSPKPWVRKKKPWQPRVCNVLNLVELAFLFIFFFAHPTLLFPLWQKVH